MNGVPDRRLRILRAIGDHIDERGYSPSIREVMDAVGLASLSSVAHHLRLLRDAGLVDAAMPYGQRQLRLTDKVARSRKGVLAEISPVIPCGPCGQDMPDDHPCPINDEAAPGATGAADPNGRNHNR